MIRTHLVNMDRFVVIERTQMDAILKEQGFQRTGCTDQECAVEMGKLMSANMIMIGSVSPLGKAIVLNVRIVDVEKGRIEYAGMEKADTESMLDRAVEKVVQQLVDRAGKKGKSRAAEAKAERRKSEDRTPGSNDRGLLSQGNLHVHGGMNYLMPFGRLKELSEAGYGAALGLRYDMKGLSPGLSTGLYYFGGAEKMTDSVAMVPLWADLGYYVTFAGSFFLHPRVSAGGAYIVVKQDPVPRAVGEPYTYKTESAFEPIARAGASGGYVFGGGLRLYLGADYTAVLEKNILGFLTLSAGAEYGF